MRICVSCRTRRAAVLLAIAAIACPVHPAPPPAAPWHRQVDTIFAPWTGAATPGCAVGINRNGVPDYAHGYGMANLEYGVPVTPQTVFHTASLAKQFTAFAIGLLAQEGKLGLDDDIRTYLPQLPQLPGHGRVITIAQLVHHTDGLREQGQLLNLAGWRGDDLYTEDDILWILARQRRLNFEPGSEIVYGNAAYTLLAVIVRQVSGQPLRAFAEERIFRPLGMRATRFRDDHTEMVPRRAAAYSPRAGGGWSISVPNIDHYGSTSVLSTVGDLLVWQQNLLDHRVGGTALVAWMRTSGVLNDGTATGYGGGLYMRTYRGLRTVGHDGADGGYRAETLLFPDHALAIAVLCNGAAIAPAALARRVAEAYLGDKMGPPPLAAPVAVADSAQAAWAGVWWSEATDEVVRLEWRDGALRQPGAAAGLVPLGGALFRPLDLAHEWRFQQPSSGPATLQIRDFWPTRRTFTRQDGALPGLPALAAFSGRYHSEETDTRYTVRLADGRLTLSWPRGYAVVLDPVGGDRFVGSLGTISFTRAANGDVSGLVISNRRLRRFVAQRVAEAG